MKRITIYLLILLLATTLSANDNLWMRFANPSQEFRTKLWWFHGETETTKEGIRQDLEEFKNKGIGGVVFYDQVHGNAERAYPSMSEEWWEMLKYAAATAKEIGLSFEMAIGNGYVTGGPWITPELAMKRTVYTDTLIHTDNPYRLQLPKKDGDYWDIATIMFEDSVGYTPIALSINPIKINPGDTIIGIDLGKMETLRGISYTVTPRGKGSTASMNIPGKSAERYFAAKYVEYPPIGVLEISEDSINWKKCCDLLPIENTIGFKSRQRTISFPNVTGKYARLRLSESVVDDESYKPISINDIRLHRRDIIDNVEVKTGLRTEVTYPTISGGNQGVIKSNNIKDVTDSVCDDGTLRLTLPTGTWRIIRFGYMPTGAKTKHGRKNLLGYEADVMSAEAANIHYDNYFKAVLDTLSAIGCPPLGVSMDSHEAGCQNWTTGFENNFFIKNGYSLTPFYAAMAGYIVDSREKSDDVLSDFRKSVAETIASEYYGTFAQRSKNDNICFTSQSMLNILADNITNRGNATKPQGEFWAYQKDGNYDCLDAASAAHIYGKNIASGEAFTDTPYFENWGELKRIANIAYCRGINEFAVCASTYQPWEYNQFDDSHSAHPYVFHRHNPQWQSSGQFWDYQARCAMLLREGNPVVDIAIYIGEEPPLKTFAYKLPEIPDGYNFDVFTIDALLNRMSVADGEIAVEGGMIYKAIVVQDRTYISPIAEHMLTKLKEDGAIIIRCDKGDSVADKLVCNEIQPDIASSMPLHFFHMESPDKDIYFVYNHSSSPLSDKIILRTERSNAEFWNPDNGEKTAAHIKNGTVELSLSPWQSQFIICEN